MVLSGPAWGKDALGIYTPILDLSCSRVLREYAVANLGGAGTTEVTYNTKFGDVLGWIAGYMTRVNFDTRGKKDYFHDLVDEVAWVASWCRDNTSYSLPDAMEALTNLRLK